MHSAKSHWAGYTALHGSLSDSDTLGAEPGSKRDSGGPLAFVDGHNFQVFIGVVISLNILVLWGETDNPDFPGWVLLDNVFLIIFIVEMVLRLKHSGLSEYYFGPDRWWAYFDTVIVGLGVSDLWITPFLLRDLGRSGGSSSLLRFLRLLRLLRMLRVFKMFEQLMVFVSALGKMVERFAWIFLVLFMFLFGFAVCLVHLLGRGEALLSTGLEFEGEAEEIQSYFLDVGTSLYTLFQLTTTDNWNDIAGPLVEINSWWRLFFVVFIVFASWTIMSVLSAEASDQMIVATNERKEREVYESEAKHKEFINFLKNAFLEADEDGNALLDKDEFQALMSKDFVHVRMKELGIAFDQEELDDLWKMLDVKNCGELNIDEFVDGLGYLQECLDTKHIVKVDYSLKRVQTRVMNRIRQTDAVVVSVLGQHEEIIERLSKQEHAHHQQQLSFWLWQQWAVRNSCGFTSDMALASAGGPKRLATAATYEARQGQLTTPFAY